VSWTRLDDGANPPESGGAILAQTRPVSTLPVPSSVPVIPSIDMLPGAARARATRPAVLLFGGTFDPVHQGHTQLAFVARDRLFAQGGGWLVFVPAAISPHKHNRPTSGHHRAEMIRLACESHSGARWSVWTEELTRAENSDAPSYWVDTLEVAAKTGTDLSFLIGADQAVAFNRWHEWERILELARPVVIARDGLRDSDGLRGGMLAGGWAEPDAARFLARAALLDTPLIDVNATAIREQLATGDSAPIDGLDPAVQRYAQGRSLYDAGCSQ
jgi:nicotinate-nucleotide adenylyltransferase